MYWQSRQQLVAPVQSVRFAVKPPSPGAEKGATIRCVGALSTKHCTPLDLHTSLASPYICFTPHLTFEHNELQGVAFLMPFPRNRHHS